MKYEKILAIINFNNEIAKRIKLANSLKDYLHSLELLMIKKFLRRKDGHYSIQ